MHFPGEAVQYLRGNVDICPTIETHLNSYLSQSAV